MAAVVDPNLAIFILFLFCCQSDVREANPSPYRAVFALQGAMMGSIVSL
jgi:hypothetical protein